MPNFITPSVMNESTFVKANDSSFFKGQNKYKRNVVKPFNLGKSSTLNESN